MISLEVAGWHHEDIGRLEAYIAGHTARTGVISARVVSARDIRRLNHDYAGRDEATDVLGFSYIESAGETGAGFSALGDVAISRDHIGRQARQAGTDEDTEFLLLLTHGALHVLGFDHQTEQQRRTMDTIQQDILHQLGRSYRDFGWMDENIT